MKWLILTVGGSDEPLVKAIKQDKPDRVVFVCSGDANQHRGSCNMVLGQGNVCGQKGEEQPPCRPNIPTQTGLTEDQYSLSIYNADPDDISQCYSLIRDRVQTVRKQYPGSTIICDYTGGTKTMSAALAMVAIDNDLDLKLVTGVRPDLVKVKDGTHCLQKAKIESIKFARLQQGVNELFRYYNYSAAEEIILTFSSEVSHNPLIHNWLEICRAFDAWDRFDHKEALKLLKDTDYIDRTQHLELLGIMVRNPDDPDWKSTKGYFLAADIMANAGRRAAQNRYDDAVARHYRAVELIAQTCLWNKCGRIDSSKVSKDQIPDKLDWKSSIEKWPCEIGLMRSWELAAALSDEIKEFYTPRKGILRDATGKRNFSILAHGTVPVSEEEYKKDLNNGMGAIVMDFLNQLADSDPELKMAVELRFPQSLPEVKE